VSKTNVGEGFLFKGQTGYEHYGFVSKKCVNSLRYSVPVPVEDPIIKKLHMLVQFALSNNPEDTGTAV
jgi:hypothetical protein